MTKIKYRVAYEKLEIVGNFQKLKNLYKKCWRFGERWGMPDLVVRIEKDGTILAGKFIRGRKNPWYVRFN